MQEIQRAALHANQESRVRYGATRSRVVVGVHGREIIEMTKEDKLWFTAHTKSFNKSMYYKMEPPV